MLSLLQNRSGDIEAVTSVHLYYICNILSTVYLFDKILV